MKNILIVLIIIFTGYVVFEWWKLCSCTEYFWQKCLGDLDWMMYANHFNWDWNCFKKIFFI